MNESKIMRGVNLFLESLSESDFERISAANKFSSDYERAQRAYDNEHPSDHEDERPTHYVDHMEMANMHSGWAEDHEHEAKYHETEGNHEKAEKHREAAVHHRRAAITYKSHRDTDFDDSDYHNTSGKAVAASHELDNKLDRYSKTYKDDIELMKRESARKIDYDDRDYDYEYKLGPYSHDNY